MRHACHLSYKLELWDQSFTSLFLIWLMLEGSIQMGAKLFFPSFHGIINLTV